jgi:predicted MFS family arabinose efflux permease
VGLVGASSLAMNALAPAIAEPLAERLGHRVMFALAAAAALGGAALARRLPQLGSIVGPSGAHNDDGVRRPARGPYVMLGVAGLAFGVMFTFIAPFALARGIQAVRGFFGAYTVAALAVRLVSGRFSDRYGYRRVSWAAGLCYGLAVVAAGVLGPAHLVLLGAGFGAAHGAVFPSLMAMVLAGAPGRRRSRALALANGSMNFGIAGVLLLGMVAGRAGYPTVFVAAGIVTLAAACLLAVERDHNQRT